MKKHKIVLVFVASFLLFSKYCWAGDDVKYYSDFQLQHKLNEEILLFVQPILRLRDDIGELYYYHCRNGFTFHAHKNLDLGAGYRFAKNKSEAGKWSDEHRWDLSIAPKVTYSGFKMMHRSRFEYRDMEIARDRWRYRSFLQIAYPTEIDGFKFVPFISEEFFYDFEIDKIHLNWVTIGASRKISESLTAGLYYRPESVRVGSKSEWNTNHVLGTKVIISF